MDAVGQTDEQTDDQTDEKNFDKEARTHLKIEENRLMVINDLRGVSKRDERVFFPIQ